MGVPFSFANRPLFFGVACKQEGPRFSYRSQHEQLPGVDGARVYRMGANPRFYTVRGWLTALTYPQLGALIASAQQLINGQIYPFCSNDGAVHPSCILNTFEPAGPFHAITGGVCCEVIGTVEDLNPTTTSRGNTFILS
jgi:hypothetical protein